MTDRRPPPTFRACPASRPDLRRSWSEGRALAQRHADRRRLGRGRDRSRSAVFRPLHADRARRRRGCRSICSPSCRRPASRWAAASATRSSAPWSWSRSPRSISIPIGMLAAAYLAELGPDSQLAARVAVPGQGADRLSVDPGRRVRLRGHRAGHGHATRPSAGGVALAVLMLPTVVLTAEEAMKMVPRKMKDAALGMGCTRTQMIWKVVLPTALPGHPDRRHAGRRARRRRIGAAAVHRAVQQLLADAACASRRRRCRS